MLNLRGIYLPDDQDDTEASSTLMISDVHFATIVGNLGAPLNTHGLDSIFQATFTSIGGDFDADDLERVEVSSNPLRVGLTPQSPDRTEHTAIRVRVVAWFFCFLVLMLTPVFRGLLPLWYFGLQEPMTNAEVAQ